MTPLVLIRAIIRREKLSDVLQALVAAGFTGATAIEASGMGGEGGVVDIRGRSYEVLIPRVVVEVVVPAEAAQKVIDIITSKAKTGHVGDGRIFVLPLIDAIRIRTGERGVA
ncbi:MAG: P-II family nitrogen regulator [Thermoproteus sp. AZ2]|jgi:nitrogen regulatory protein P-II 1|uniref:P-II family nitrogen regulator n=1 Tax=Thermoproteus sp. AZ2 TaxID=1609232 RepID=A0ACC6UYM0_9CREN|nr:MAG: nitrogen regulatory protein P-II [Thermoproteus sp. AZ2]